MRLLPHVPCHLLVQLARTHAVVRALATHRLPDPTADFQPRRSRTEITFSTWPILNVQAQRLVNRNGYRNTLPPSNALYVLNALPAPTTCGPTYARTPTKDPSYVQSAAKHLRDSTTANDTKVCIPVKRSSSAAVSSPAAANGVAVDDLPAQMLLAAISDLKLAESASSPCSMRSLPSVTAFWNITRSNLAIFNRFPSRW